MDRLFKLNENNTTVRREFAAGLTTFMTMSYILAINPIILGDAGMNPHGVLIATCLASTIGCFCMGFMANLPFALSAGMGINALTITNFHENFTTHGICADLAIVGLFITILFYIRRFPGPILCGIIATWELVRGFADDRSRGTDNVYHGQV